MFDTFPNMLTGYRMKACPAFTFDFHRRLVNVGELVEIEQCTAQFGQAALRQQLLACR